MINLRKTAKQIPLLHSLYRKLNNRYVSYQLRGSTPEQVFTGIYRDRIWGGKNSVSGTGSDEYQTKVIIDALPSVFRDFAISTMLDIPCGDFHWMKSVDLMGIDYTGADIVGELIEKTTEQYGRDGVRFQKLNLIEDKLPKVDLVFCRDCLVHLSFEDIFSALSNLSNSESEYLLTTTFTGRTDNQDIPTGQWRPLNLERAPFRLPKPLKIINEDCTERDGDYTDKALGLWKIADIRLSLTS